ncbi:uncharacterized protein BCR38DRAFT_474074 [Pseudomassariella vexata]|uniref:Uncharacterized protein n=1 Tax=Pseudomassariella vexata TaxID=1141098 RepID=A0A1Y2E0N6_9PEZI|nr:uncharacterized protein BCR38DRAFT_474074 [Pseudomassariella vexata]ORY65103.1 hypothetical protein BCR38DRAFT_474074 [Pseudomassariella vexata]
MQSCRIKCFAFEWVYYEDADEQTIDCYPLGDEDIFGYKAFGFYSQELLDILYDACFERKIPVHLNKKLTKVVDETDSKLRNYVSPDAQKKFMGMAALIWEMPTKQLRIPEDKDEKFMVSVITSKMIFLLAPQKPDGSAILSGTLFNIEEHGREGWMDGWDKLLTDKKGLMERVRQNMDIWPDIVKSEEYRRVVGSRRRMDKCLKTPYRWLCCFHVSRERKTEVERRIDVLAENPPKPHRRAACAVETAKLHTFAS